MTTPSSSFNQRDSNSPQILLDITAKDIFDRVPRFFSICDVQGNLLYLNHAYPADATQRLLGQPFTVNVPPHRQNIEWAAFHKSVANQVCQVSDYTDMTAEGDGHWYQFTYNPVVRNGQVQAVIVESVVVQHYITGRNENAAQADADYAFLGQNDLLRWMMDSVEQGVVISDNDGRIEYINPYMERVFERSAQEVIGRNVSDYVLPAGKAEINAQRELRLAGLNSQYEIDVIAADGSLRHMRATASPRMQADRVTGVIVVLNNLSETAEIEARLQQSRDNLSAANFALERAARMKDEFLASMSHELRTPLTAILGLAEGLQEQVLGTLNLKQQEAVTTIESSGRHLLHLINEILDISKIEAGLLHLDLHKVAVGDICKNSLAVAKEMATKKRIKTFMTLDSSVEWIQADERRLKQMLVNLISNAVKFTPENGRVGLEVTGDAELGVAQFSVWDTGIGIAPKDIERLFQPFVQLDSTLARQYTGTGLGLALVARVAELHGGSITVESEVGAGSRFTLSLPWNNDPRSPMDIDVGESRYEMGTDGFEENSTTIFQPVTTESDTAPLILLVEDNEANILTLSSYLEARGYPLIIARHGGEALTLARSNHPSLILMDVQMPVMDGIEATQQLRRDADPRIANVPIIALTALAMPGDRNRLLLAGANEYLAKPVNLKNLVMLIEEMLARNNKANHVN